MVHGYQWLCMDFCGLHWVRYRSLEVVISVYMHGYQWLYAWSLWLSVVICMVISGYAWLVF